MIGLHEKVVCNHMILDDQVIPRSLNRIRIAQFVKVPDLLDLSRLADTEVFNRSTEPMDSIRFRRRPWDCDRQRSARRSRDLLLRF
jgi:hypothetical protein